MDIYGLSADAPLIDRLRARAADPERRVDVRPSAFAREVKAMSLADLLGQLGSLRSDLSAVVENDRQGVVDPDLTARADAWGQRMNAREMSDLTSVASEEQLAAAESALGFGLPAFLRRLYAEVANGGFGPGSGLLSVESAVDAYRRQRATCPSTYGFAWPTELLPIVERDVDYDTIELRAAGRIISWDVEELEEDDHAAWQRSFREEARSLEAWLEEWLISPTQAEQTATLLSAAMADQARASREMLARMPIEERRAMGLPDEGWESIVWGGLGWDEDETGENGENARDGA